MITTLFVESEEPLICAAGMPVCGGELVIGGVRWQSA